MSPSSRRGGGSSARASVSEVKSDVASAPASVDVTPDASACVSASVEDDGAASVVPVGCTLNALTALCTELQIVGELRPGDRLTVPQESASDSSSLSSLPSIDRSGVWQSLVRAMRGQSRADTVAYVASLVSRVQQLYVQDQQRRVEMSPSDADTLIYAIGCARAGINLLRSTYADDTRVSTLLGAHSLALNACQESLVQRKAQS